MLYLGGVGLAVFLDLLLLAKRKKSRADWILASWLLVIALHLLMVTFLRNGLYPQFLGIEQPLPLLHGPLLYLYTLALTGRHLARNLFIHLFVPTACFVYLIPFIALPATEKIFVYENEGIGYEAFLFVRGILIPLSGIAYILLSLYTIRLHRRAIVNEFSTIDKLNLDWLKYLIIGLSTIWVFVIFGNDDLIFSAAVLFTFFIGFFGIRQGVIFNTHPTTAHQLPHTNPVTEAEGAQPGSSAETSKYQKSGLSAKNAEELHQRLISLMNTQKPYRQSEFSLADLADHLDVPANHVSQVINEREGKNFYDYVNSLRVQEFIDVCQTPESQKLTLFAIAQEAGFNSKSSFNRYFKKVTGQSPSAYVQKFLISRN